MLRLTTKSWRDGPHQRPAERPIGSWTRKMLQYVPEPTSHLVADEEMGILLPSTSVMVVDRNGNIKLYAPFPKYPSQLKGFHKVFHKIFHYVEDFFDDLPRKLRAAIHHFDMVTESWLEDMQGPQFPRWEESMTDESPVKPLPERSTEQKLNDLLKLMDWRMEERNPADIVDANKGREEEEEEKRKALRNWGARNGQRLIRAYHAAIDIDDRDYDDANTWLKPKDKGDPQYFIEHSPYDVFEERPHLDALVPVTRAVTPRWSGNGDELSFAGPSKTVAARPVSKRLSVHDDSPVSVPIWLAQEALENAQRNNLAERSSKQISSHQLPMAKIPPDITAYKMVSAALKIPRAHSGETKKKAPKRVVYDRSATVARDIKGLPQPKRAPVIRPPTVLRDANGLPLAKQAPAIRPAPNGKVRSIPVQNNSVQNSPVQQIPVVPAASESGSAASGLSHNRPLVNKAAVLHSAAEGDTAHKISVAGKNTSGLSQVPQAKRAPAILMQTAKGGKPGQGVVWW